MLTENYVSTNEAAKIKTVGFENKEDLLEEITHRLSLLDKNCIILKNIPRYLSRTSLKDIIPEMITCRFPESSKKCNSGYVIVQFQDPEILSKYIDLLNGKVIQSKKIEAKRFETVKKNMNIDHFDLKGLYYNGLKSETKMREIKSIYQNAYIILPTDQDNNCKGMVTLLFKTEEEALSAFAENKMILHGLKCELNYLIKKNIGLELNCCKFSFDKSEELIKEIISRFESQNNRTVMIKNLPSSFTLVDLKKMIPSMRNCKISPDKKIGFLEFENADLATASVKNINGTLVKGSKVRAFVAKKAVHFTDLSTFNLKKLHLTNLSMDTTQSDLQVLFPNSAVEIHLNTDNTCIGNATITFNSEKEALEIFSNNNLSVKNVSLGINFHIDTKDSENSKKRQFDGGSDDENNNTKRLKVETQKPLTRSTTNEKSKISDVKVATGLNRKKSLIPKSLNTKKESESSKSSIKKTTEKVISTVEKKSLVPIKQEKKPINNSKIGVQKKQVVKVETKQTKIAPMKRKFQEIEKEENDSSVKISRIAKNKLIAKAKK